MERLWWTLTRARVRLAYLRRRPDRALERLRPVAVRRPGNVEVRLLLAELELAAGELERAIAEAGMAIQLAPKDVRGMSLLLQAQARQDARPPAADARPTGTEARAGTAEV